MLDIHSLEKRWLRYKLKRVLPLIIISLVFLASSTGIIFLLPKTYLQKPIDFNKTMPVKQSLNTHTIKPVEEVNNTLFLEPSMEFMQNFSGSEPFVESSSSPQIVKQKPVTNVPTIKVPKETILSLDEKQETKSINSLTKNSSALINKTDNKLEIDDLEVRFKNNPNSSLGLFISRYHYDHGNYTQSYNYALKTNNINDKLDESWIIFAKSLVKLGKSEQAKKTLRIYIEQSNSEAAKTLLSTIEKGTFK